MFGIAGIRAIDLATLIVTDYDYDYDCDLIQVKAQPIYLNNTIS